MTVWQIPPTRAKDRHPREPISIAAALTVQDPSAKDRSAGDMQELEASVHVIERVTAS
jgi:hypothetical protein